VLLVEATDYPVRSPDAVCADRIEPAGLDLRLIAGDDSVGELPLIVVRGTPDALRFLADLLRAVADSPTIPARFQMAPNAAGQFHFSASAEVGLYIDCIEPPDRSGSETSSA
jgi:hypothetical protein